MISDIIGSIGKSIKKEFGENFIIYTEHIEQGFKKPCFYIKNILTEEKRFLKTRYKFNNSFVISYYPENEKIPKEEMYKIGDELMEVLELINLKGAVLKGTNRSYKTVGDVLNFFVDYNFFGYIETPKDEFMENLEMKIKEGK